MNSICVTNLDRATTEPELRAHFEAVGRVENVTILFHRDDGRSLGVAFVEMAEGLAERALEGLQGSILAGVSLRLNGA